ncbi:MAG: glycine dehydrogenase (aminomethyl-transferring), partial [bacterium]|nr:glycine dehydrogenase (aminomethyl-transferring) [bacterium]
MKEALFSSRHIGPSDLDQAEMLREMGLQSLEALIDQTIPEKIRLKQTPDLPVALSESKMLETIGGMAAKNQMFRSLIGLGYYGTITPTVVLRNVLENPG